MGLDITYYRNAQLVHPIVLDADGMPEWPPGDECERLTDDEGLIAAWHYPDFVGRLEPLRPGFYRAERVGDFAAGSYGGYGVRRKRLAEIFWGPDSERAIRAAIERGESGPFLELIWFADNEGCIGPRVSAKLAADFKEHRNHFITNTVEVYSLEMFDNFTKAFAVAADGGLVRFH